LAVVKYRIKTTFRVGALWGSSIGGQRVEGVRAGKEMFKKEYSTFEHGGVKIWGKEKNRIPVQTHRYIDKTEKGEEFVSMG